MRISEIAKMLNVPSKDLLVEIESFRPELGSKGLSLPPSPKPSNRLEDEVAREVLAIFDRRRLEERHAAEEAERLRRQDEHEKEIREAQERMKREEEERIKKEEERRRLADIELKKKQQEVAAQQAHAESAKATAVAAPHIAPTGPVVPIVPISPRAGAGPEAPPETFVEPRRGRKKSEAGEKERGEKPAKLIVREIPVMKDDFEVRGRKRRPPERDREDTEGARRRRAAKLADPDQEVGKRFRPSRLFSMEDVPKRPLVVPPRFGRSKSARPEAAKRGAYVPEKPPEPKIARFIGDFTLGEFAEKSGVAIGDLMRQLLMMGEAITINQILNPDLAELLAAENNIEINIIREGDELDIAEFLKDDVEDDLLPRPPVVTVMGHVDHGKTTLLDSIRQTNVVDTEHGGITQHIGAYMVSTPKGQITFLDTPGHEAFTAMRARGATMTDIVILVVAANDGIMPQTVEAINHARAANVPIVVAVNKIEVPGANVMRVKQELMKYELVPEELGGSTIVAEVSAKQKIGIQELLDMVLLQSEIQELKANPNRPAQGTVIESHVDPQRGVLATILVQRGTLRLGDLLLAGSEYGRVRAMNDDKGQPIEEAGPSTPVEILGMSGPPPAGEIFVVMEDEVKAREIAEERTARRRRRGLAQRSSVTLENLSKHIEEGKVKDLFLILKADVQGSLEAISNAILKLPSQKVRPVLIHTGVGAIGGSDVDLAAASQAIIIGFGVPVDPQAAEQAEQTGVEIKTYRIIYDLLDELRRAMLGLLEKKFQEVDQAKAVILQVFQSSKFGTVAGCRVESGTVVRGQKARVVRGGKVIHKGEINSLRRVKDDVKQVPAGTECGIGIEGYGDLEAGDVIETFILEELAPDLG